MEIRGVTPDMFTAIVAHVSTNVYDGNVCADYWRSGTGPASLRYLRGGVPCFRARVIVKSSRGTGARRSASGRRMPCACWHVFRDVVRATLASHPGATFRTSLAYYTSDNFETTYPATGAVNVGSMLRPARLPDLCECADQPDDVAVSLIDARPFRLASCQPYQPPAIVDTTLAPASVWVAERDQALAIEAGECAWCGGSTAGLGDVFAWDTQQCQSAWQEKYGAGVAALARS